MFKRKNKVTNGKVKSRKVNPTNSNMGTTCVAPNECCHRHTTMCDNCVNNIGPEWEHQESYFVPRTESV